MLPKKYVLILNVIILIAANLACGFGVPATAELTAEPTIAFTATSAPPTPAPATSQPDALEGFSQRGIPGVSPQFLVPDWWIFSTELLPRQNAFFVTKEKIPTENSWVFTTGLTVSAISNPELANVEAANKVLDNIANLASTKTVVDRSQGKQGKLTFSDLLIEAEFENFPQDSPDREKTVFYTVIPIPAERTLYVLSFESPTADWKTEWTKGEVMINNFRQQLAIATEAESPLGFKNTLANTTIAPAATLIASAPVLSEARPSAMQPAMQSHFLSTEGGNFGVAITQDPPGVQAVYALKLNQRDALPPGATMTVFFENPQDASTAIAVRLFDTPAKQFSLYSPLLSGFKCQNYWMLIHVYADATEAEILDGYVQWIYSSADLSKVTSNESFLDGSTCR